MADRIITVTDPSVVTNDTLASYNNYTDQPSPNTLLGSMTPTEATNGKTVTLSDGVVHEVTTKPVGTTNGEFAAVVSNAVTVDLTTATNYALQFLEAQTDEITVPLPFLQANDFYFDMRLKITSRAPSDLSFMGSSVDTKMQFGTNGTDEPYFLFASAGTFVSGESFPLNTWHTIRFKYTQADANAFRRFMTTNETINESTDEIGNATSISGGLVDGDINFVLGKFTATNYGDYEIDWIDADGIKYEFNAIVGGQVLDSNGLNPLTIVTDRADVNDMLVPIV